MWVGVEVGIASVKFSTSPNMLGFINIIVENIIIINKAGVVSLIMKYGKNFILSTFGVSIMGLDEPVS